MPVLFFSPPLPSSHLALSAKTQIPQKRLLASLPRKTLSVFVVRASDNETGAVIPVAVEEVPKKGEASVPAAVEEVPKKEETSVPVAVEVKPVEEEKKSGALQSNGAALKVEASVEAPRFKDPRWVAGTWDLEPFKKNGTTDWDAVIDAETRRRKWLEENPEASSNMDPVIFDTSIIPWWAWMKRFHLPEAELLNGRAAMVGFFMAYFVDALTGVGLVDQMGNFFCKTLLLVAVAGVLLIRKNEDIDNLKKLIEETTFYDNQWKATWQDDDSSDSSTK